MFLEGRIWKDRGVSDVVLVCWQEIVAQESLQFVCWGCARKMRGCQERCCLILWKEGTELIIGRARLCLSGGGKGDGTFSYNLSMVWRPQPVCLYACLSPLSKRDWWGTDDNAGFRQQARPPAN